VVTNLTPAVAEDFENMTNQEKIAAEPGRCKLCKHYLMGTCPAGDECTLLHDTSVKMSDEQKVFIGGIPRNCASRTLIRALKKIGFEPINIPKCHPMGFAPKVCFKDVATAKKLLKMARMEVENVTVDVRRFHDSRGTNSNTKSIFVAGLPEGCTGKMLMDGIESHGFTVERCPIVNEGETFCERVEMETVEMVDGITCIEKLAIKGPDGTEKVVLIKRFEDDNTVMNRSGGVEKKRPSPWNTLNRAAQCHTTAAVGWQRNPGSFSQQRRRVDAVSPRFSRGSRGRYASYSQTHSQGSSSRFSDFAGSHSSGAIPCRWRQVSPNKTI